MRFIRLFNFRSVSAIIRDGMVVILMSTITTVRASK